jgi:hypothetical protein
VTTNPSILRRHPVIFLFLLFVLVRIVFAVRLPIFNDESIYLQWGMIVAGHPDKWNISLLADGKQPGTPILLIPTWLLPFDPLVTGRMISIIFAALTLLINIAIYKELFQNASITQKIQPARGVDKILWLFTSKREPKIMDGNDSFRAGSEKTAKFSSTTHSPPSQFTAYQTPLYFILFCIFCPYLILTDSMTLQEASLTFFLTIAFWATVKCLKKPSVTSGVILGTGLALGWWIKSTALLAVPAIILLIILTLISNKRKTKSLLLMSFSAVIAFLFITGPLLFSPLFSAIPAKETGRAFSLTQILTFPLGLWWIHIRDTFQFINGYATPITVLLFITGIAFDRNRKTAIPAIFFLVPTLSAVIAGRTLSARYISPFIPAYLMVAADGLSSLSVMARGGDKIWRLFTPPPFLKKTYFSKIYPEVSARDAGSEKTPDFPSPTEVPYRRLQIPLAIFSLLAVWSIIFIFSPLTFYGLVRFSPAAKLDFAQYVTGWTSGWGVKDAVDWIISHQGPGRTLVIMRPDAGNPESAMVVYLNRSPNITAIFANEVNAFMKMPAAAEVKTYYFVSRGDQLMNLAKDLMLMAKFPKPLDPEYVGVWQFASH